jgi:hypothetical protein
MDSSATISPTDPRDVNPGLSTQDAELVARADQRLAHAYEQIALADEQLARVNEQIFKLENEGARKSRLPSRGRPALRGFIGLLLTAGICTAAFAWHSYGETVRPMIAQWTPQLAAASSLPLEAPKVAADMPPAVQLAAADAATSQVPAPAQTAAHDAAASPMPPETTQWLQTMVRDLADLRQEIEQLKAGHEALTRETAGNAKQLNELKESQQTARAIANVSEQNQRRTSVAQPQPVANSVRKPVSAVAPRQVRAQAARAPVQLQPQQQ